MECRAKGGGEADVSLFQKPIKITLPTSTSAEVRFFLYLCSEVKISEPTNHLSHSGVSEKIHNSYMAVSGFKFRTLNSDVLLFMGQGLECFC